MELFIASTALVAAGAALTAIEEHIRWMESYDEAGEEDRQYQENKNSNYDIGYHE